MSKAKYKQGKQICTISDFDNNGKRWYKWNGKTTHRSVLISLQYRTLKGFILNGMIYEADLIDDEPSHPFADDVMTDSERGEEDETD